MLITAIPRGKFPASRVEIRRQPFSISPVRFAIRALAGRGSISVWPFRATRVACARNGLRGTAPRAAPQSRAPVGASLALRPGSGATPRRRVRPRPRAKERPRAHRRNRSCGGGGRRRGHQARIAAENLPHRGLAHPEAVWRPAGGTRHRRRPTRCLRHAPRPASSCSMSSAPSRTSSGTTARH